jgi:hypothetical protein
MPVADQITPLIQRQPEPEEEEEKPEELEEEEELETIQAKSNGGRSTEANENPRPKPFSVPSGGQPLSRKSRDYFEPRFGYDFGDVRVHTGVHAAESARSINARAYTTGKNIVFGSGQYAPESRDGQRLLAHELTHVVQQGDQIPGNRILAVQRLSDAITVPEEEAIVVGEKETIPFADPLLNTITELLRSKLPILKPHIVEQIGRDLLHYLGKTGREDYLRTSLSVGVGISGQLLEELNRFLEVRIAQAVAEKKHIPSYIPAIARALEFDRLLANMEAVWSAALDARTTPDLIALATKKHKELFNPERPMGPFQKSAIAKILLEIYRIIDQRIIEAGLDEHELCKIEGLCWSPTDPLSGILSAIYPFGYVNAWAATAGQAPVKLRFPERDKKGKKKVEPPVWPPYPVHEEKELKGLEFEKQFWIGEAIFKLGAMPGAAAKRAKQCLTLYEEGKLNDWLDTYSTASQVINFEFDNIDSETYYLDFFVTHYRDRVRHWLNDPSLYFQDFVIHIRDIDKEIMGGLATLHSKIRAQHGEDYTLQIIGNYYRQWHSTKNHILQYYPIIKESWLWKLGFHA